MRRNWKKLIAMLLSAAMVFTMLPADAYAAEAADVGTEETAAGAATDKAVSGNATETATAETETEETAVTQPVQAADDAEETENVQGAMCTVSNNAPLLITLYTGAGKETEVSAPEVAYGTTVYCRGAIEEGKYMHISVTDTDTNQEIKEFDMGQCDVEPYSVSCNVRFDAEVRNKISFSATGSAIDMVSFFCDVDKQFSVSRNMTFIPGDIIKVQLESEPEEGYCVCVSANGKSAYLYDTGSSVEFAYYENSNVTVTLVEKGKTDISGCSVTLSTNKVNYDANIDEICNYADNIGIRVMLSGNELVKDTDYSCNLEKQTDDGFTAGIYNLVLNGSGQYTGEVTIKNAVTIVPKSIEDSDISILIDPIYYLGKGKVNAYEPNVNVSWMETDETSYDCSCSLSYNNNDGSSKSGSVTISGNGDYTGTIVKDFEIIRKYATVSINNPYPGNVTFFDSEGKKITGYETEICDPDTWTVYASGNDKYEVRLYTDSDELYEPDVDETIYPSSASANISVPFDESAYGEGSDDPSPIRITVTRIQRYKVTIGAGMDAITIYDEDGKPVANGGTVAAGSEITVSLNRDIEDTEYYEIYENLSEKDDNDNPVYTNNNTIDNIQSRSFTMEVLRNFGIYAEKGTRVKLKFEPQYATNELKQYVGFYTDKSSTISINAGDYVLSEEAIFVKCLKNPQDGKALRIAAPSMADYEGYYYISANEGSGVRPEYISGNAVITVKMADRPRLKLSLGAAAKNISFKCNDNIVSENDILPYGSSISASSNDGKTYILYYSSGNNNANISVNGAAYTGLGSVQPDGASVEYLEGGYAVYLDEAAAKDSVTCKLVASDGAESAATVSNNVIKVPAGYRLKVYASGAGSGKAIRLQALKQEQKVVPITYMYNKNDSCTYDVIGKKIDRINISDEPTHKVTIDNSYAESVSFDTVLSDGVSPKDYLKSESYICNYAPWKNGDSGFDSDHVQATVNSGDKKAYVVTVTGKWIYSNDNDENGEDKEKEFSKSWLVSANASQKLEPDCDAEIEGYGWYATSITDIKVAEAGTAAVTFKDFNSDITAEFLSKAVKSPDGSYQVYQGTEMDFTSSSDSIFYKVTVTKDGKTLESSKPFTGSDFYKDNYLYSYTVSGGETFTLSKVDTQQLSINAIGGEGLECYARALNGYLAYASDGYGDDYVFEPGTTVTLSLNSVYTPADSAVNIVLVSENGTVWKSLNIKDELHPVSFVMPHMDIRANCTAIANADVRDVAKCSVSCGKTETVYNGKPQTADVRVRYNGIALTQGTDYDEPVWSDNTDVGTAKVTITATGVNYSGAKTFDAFKITAKPLNDTDISISMAGTVMKDGSPEYRPVVTAVWNGKELEEGIDYKVTYSNDGKDGSAVIEGINNFSGSVTKTFKLVNPSVSDDTVITIKSISVDDAGIVYDGTEKKPAVTVMNSSGGILTEGVSYTLTYVNNVYAGTDTASVTATGIGFYKGSIAATFSIARKDIASADVMKTAANVKYNRKSAKIQSAPVLAYAGMRLAEGSDYTVTYEGLDAAVSAESSNTTVYADVTGNGNYTGTAKIAYNVVKTVKNDITIKTFKGVTFSLPKTSYVYSGTAYTPAVEVKAKTGVTAPVSGDYTVTYTNNINAGTATVNIAGVGNYIGTQKLTFKIAKKPLTYTDFTAKLAGSSVDMSAKALADETYDGSNAPAPVLTDTAAGKELRAADVKYSYSGNTKVTKSGKSAKVTVKGKGNYSGSLQFTYNITKPDISGYSIRINDLPYTGKNAAVKEVIAYNAAGNTVTLKAGKAVNITYPKGSRKEIGIYQVTVKVKGNNLSGISADGISASVKVVQCDLGNCVISPVKACKAGKKPKLTVKINGNKLKENRDYSVTISGNETKGTGTATITAFDTANFKGTQKVTFVVK